MSDEDKACRVVGPGERDAGRQETEYVPGVSAQSVGARGICLHLSIIPPGGRAKAHVHADHETAIYVLNGAIDTWFGEELDRLITAGQGDFIYIPAGMLIFRSTEAAPSLLRSSSQEPTRTTKRTWYSCPSSMNASAVPSRCHE